MKSVSRFEYNLLRILQCFLRRTPLETVLPVIVQGCKRPPCLNRDTVDLVQDTLAKGITLLLACEGWRQERFLRGDSPASGRLWERTNPENCGLVFSEQSLAFLQWITSTEILDAKTNPWKPSETLSLGDRLLFVYAYDALRHTISGEVLAKTHVFRSDAVCSLIFTDDLATRRNLKIDWSPWTNVPGTIILECLQRRLVNRWLHMEQGKGRITDAKQMQHLGRTQRTILRSFLEWSDRTERRDLARFILETAVQLLPADPDPQRWIGRLNLRGLKMADRADNYRSAFAFIEQFRRLQEWDEHARTIGYFDEGYTAAQFWKSEWERTGGNELCQRADVLLRHGEHLSLGDAKDARSEASR